jgi:ATP-dependent Clp protease protease subunit
MRALQTPITTRDLRYEQAGSAGHPEPRLEDDEDKEEGKEEKKDSGFLLEKSLFDARTVIVSGPIDDKLCTATVAKLLALEGKDAEAPITIFINSPGGSADAGFAMYDMIRFVRCPVRCVVNGLCASAAVLVFLAAPKGQRFSLPSSRFLLHQPSTGAQGTASDLEITAQQIVQAARAATTGSSPRPRIARPRRCWRTSIATSGSTRRRPPTTGSSTAS